jgi:hypothetical protein
MNLEADKFFYAFLIKSCERHRDLYVVEQYFDDILFRWVDKQEYQYEPTRFRALYVHAQTQYHLSIDDNPLIRLRYPAIIWELRRRNEEESI